MTTATDTAAPPYPCSKRVHKTQLEAEQAWAKLKQIDPMGTQNLICYWCCRCWGWHCGHRRRSP
jgi:hypothetical protein